MKCPVCHNDMARTGDGTNFWFVCKHCGKVVGKNTETAEEEPAETKSAE